MPETTAAARQVNILTQSVPVIASEAKQSSPGAGRRRINHGHIRSDGRGRPRSRSIAESAGLLRYARNDGQRVEAFILPRRLKIIIILN